MNPSTRSHHNHQCTERHPNETFSKVVRQFVTPDYRHMFIISKETQILFQRKIKDLFSWAFRSVWLVALWRPEKAWFSGTNGHAAIKSISAHAQCVQEWRRFVLLACSAWLLVVFAAASDIKCPQIYTACHQSLICVRVGLVPRQDANLFWEEMSPFVDFRGWKGPSSCIGQNHNAIFTDVFLFCVSLCAQYVVQHFAQKKETSRAESKVLPFVKLPMRKHQKELQEWAQRKQTAGENHYMSPFSIWWKDILPLWIGLCRNWQFKWIYRHLAFMRPFTSHLLHFFQGNTLYIQICFSIVECSVEKKRNEWFSPGASNTGLYSGEVSPAFCQIRDSASSGSTDFK